MQGKTELQYCKTSPRLGTQPVSFSFEIMVSLMYPVKMTGQTLFMVYILL